MSPGPVIGLEKVPPHAATKAVVAMSVELLQGLVVGVVAVVPVGTLVAKDHVPLATWASPVAALES